MLAAIEGIAPAQPPMDHEPILEALQADHRRVLAELAGVLVGPASAARDVDRGGMSARGGHRALRVARAIADLAGEATVGASRFAEALQYRACKRRRFAVGG